MKTYKITMQLDDPVYNGEHTTNWNGYTAQQAIAQAMLSYGYNGSRELKVLEIHRIDRECLTCGPRKLLAKDGLVCPHE